MKAYTPSDEEELELRNDRLDRAILQFNNLTMDDLCKLSVKAKEKLYFEELDRQQQDEYWGRFREDLLNRRRLIDDGFQYFNQLPNELRMQIWKHAMEEEIQPRTHIITKKDGHYISNQGLSPLLSVCSESRIAYVESGAEAAFHTYVRFATDIIYIRPFPDSNGCGPWWNASDGSMMHDHTIFEDEAPLLAAAREEREAQKAAFLLDNPEETYEWDDEQDIAEGMFWGTAKQDAYQAGAEITLTAFLDNISAKKIKRLAMTIDFFKQIPLPDIAQLNFLAMRRRLIAWDETVLVFDDMRESNAAWRAVDTSLRDSRVADKMRKNHNFSSVLRRIEYVAPPDENKHEFDPMRYRFVFVEGAQKKLQVPANEQKIDSLIQRLRAAGVRG